MQSFLRLTLFIFFGGCGIAAAVWFAIWSDPTAAPTAELQANAGPSAVAATSAVAEPIQIEADPDSDFTMAPTMAKTGLPVAHHADVRTPAEDNSRPKLDISRKDRPSLGTPAGPQIAAAEPMVGQQVGDDEAQQNGLKLDEIGKMLQTLTGNLAPGGANSPAAKQPAAAVPAHQVPRPAPAVEPGLQPNDSPSNGAAAPRVDDISASNSSRASIDADGRFQLNTKPDADLRQVLELLSKKSGLNILASTSVQGTVSASLNNVDTMTALDAILKSTGYVAYQEGDIIFVGTAEEYRQRKHRMQGIDTRIYRPNYVTSTEFQQLITPLLTAEIGAISISSAAEAGIQSGSTEVGGDSYTGNEVVLVRDYENVLEHIDQVFHEVDRRPDQVAIEAMILSVSLSDETDLGVDFELLKNKANLRLISGSPPTTLGAIVADGGLKVGFLDSSTTIFVEALETIGDTNVIATPRLLVLNKQRAEILIGSELGYVSTTVTETAVTQAVEFLEVGTQLRIRPFIASDGMVRMEIHPELSTGSVRVESGFTLPDKEVTEVTTNIMARDGSTVVIGGLMREDIGKTTTQIPFLGSLPLVGPLFRQKNETTDKSEIIVLITPRILRDKDLDHEADRGATEFHHRQAIVAEKMTWLSRLSMSRRQLFMAREAWAAGNQNKAMRHVNRSLYYYPQSREAIDLRADIFNGVQFGDHTGHGPYLPPPPPMPLDGQFIAPWLLDDLEAEAMGRGEPIPPGTPAAPLELQSP